MTATLHKSEAPDATGAPGRGVADALAEQAGKAQSSTSAGGYPLTLLTNSRGLLTKTYSLDAGGRLAKQTAAYLSRGTVQRVTVAGPADLALLIGELKHTQALAWGLTEQSKAEVRTKGELHKHPGAIARDREHFAFHAGPAVLMLDHDSAADEPLEGAAERLRGALLQACPALASAPMLWAASGSSSIFNGTEQVQGLRGQRLYIFVRNGVDIPRAGRALYERLWLAGFGRFEVSAAGTLLDRNLIDSSVWNPERLDFIAGAACIEPLHQERPAPVWWNDGAAPFDTAQILELAAEEKEAVDAARGKARAAVAAQAAEVRAAYVEQRGGELAATRGLDIERAKEIVTRAVEDSLLFADFALLSESGDSVTVGEVLDDPARWHGKRFADPVERDYRGDRRIAFCNLRSGGKPYLFSHAHGGRRFELLRQPSLLRVTAGEDARLADETLHIIRDLGELFDRADGMGLVRVAEGRALAVTPGWLRDYIDQHVKFQRFDQRSKGWVPTGVPDLLPKTLIERNLQRGLPRLVGVVDAPVLRPDGTVLDVPGYDQATGLLLVTEEIDPERVPPAPSMEQVRRAFGELWEPVGLFPFDSDTSRGVMLAAMLTACVRGALRTAPGFGFSAPCSGTGKTRLAQVCAALGGHATQASAPPRDDGEAAKELFAHVLQGRGLVFWDNIVRPLDGDALCAFLTAPTFSGRVLGASTMVDAPNRTLALFSGNNLRIHGDAARRILVCRIDAKLENPSLRSFPFDPLQVVQARRQRLVRAALTVLRGYQTHGIPFAEGRMASFETWDDLIRQTVDWLGRAHVGVGLGDPLASALVSMAEDPSKGVLGEVLRAWNEAYGSALFPAGQVWEEAETGLGTKDRALWEAIQAIGAGDPRFDRTRFGRWLAMHESEVVDGLRLERGEDRHRKVNAWRVARV